MVYSGSNGQCAGDDRIKLEKRQDARSTFLADFPCDSRPKYNDCHPNKLNELAKPFMTSDPKQKLVAFDKKVEIVVRRAQSNRVADVVVAVVAKVRPLK